MKSNTQLLNTLSNVKLLAFDFDGVLTNNKVIVRSDGLESVVCSRADGLAFDYLNSIKFPTYVVSTERNRVVQERCKKLKIPFYSGINNKLSIIKKISEIENIPIKNFLFIGNDLNDYEVMKECGFSACPFDSHSKIKKIATFSLKTKGGDGVARELLENILKLNLL